MSDGKPNVQIPAWQRASTTPSASDDPVLHQPAPGSTEAADSILAGEEPEPQPEPVPSADTSPTTAPQAEEPADQDQHVLHTSDFQEFKQQQQQKSTQPPPAPRQTAPPPPHNQTPAPPIITYPEFLVGAHQPPPLLTPGRILNTLYAAGGAAATVYGASKWIISPLVDELSAARHDFLSHSQTKVDDFNARLATIVSKMPEPLPATSDADADAESITSDPTELYHRDMGTQTSPPPSPKPLTGADEEKDFVQHAEDTLTIMRGRLEQLAEGSEKAGESHRDRLESINKLRHYLDGLVYGTVNASTWAPSGDAITMKHEKSDMATDDPIEELKKEIRSVKGVLLSAKRFPAASRPIAGAA